MAQSQDIIEFADRVSRHFNPEQIVLFGSHAYGDPTPDSDVDLLVVMPHEEAGYRIAARILSAVAHPFRVDLLVRSPRMIRERLALNDFFLREIFEKGIVLHDAVDERVGREGRRRLRRRRAAAIA